MSLQKLMHHYFKKPSLLSLVLVALLLGTVALTANQYKNNIEQRSSAEEVPNVPTSVNSTLPWLKTMGNQIVTEVGNQPVTLRGANVLRYFWVQNMNFERVAIPHLTNNWKGNLVNHAIASQPINANDQTYLAALDEYVALTEQNNMYLIFTYFSPQINGDHPTQPDQAAQDALVRLAQRYHGKSHIMYLLQAEPHNVSWSTLLPIYNNMVTAIRQASAPYKPLILAAGTNWGRDTHWAITQPITADGGINIVYSSHPYNPQSDFQQLFLDTYNANLPVILTEFGTGGFMSQSDTNALLQITHQRNIPWTAWIFDNEGPPTLLDPNSARTDFIPSNPYGVSVKNEMMTTPPLPVISGSPAPTSLTPTAVPSPTMVPSATPTSAPSIITITSGQPYVVDTRLEVPTDWPYVDRTDGSTYYETVPAAYLNLQHIRTANGDKTSTSDNFLRFNLSQSATVYVVHDDRAPDPLWLTSN